MRGTCGAHGSVRTLAAKTSRAFVKWVSAKNANRANEVRDPTITPVGCLFRSVELFDDSSFRLRLWLWLWLLKVNEYADNSCCSKPPLTALSTGARTSRHCLAYVAGAVIEPCKLRT